MSRFDEQGRLYVTTSAPVDVAPTSLMLYRANGSSTGISTGDYIQLRQEAPNPPEWFNLTTRTVLIDPPTNIGPIGGIANYELINWRAIDSSIPSGYNKGDYLYEIVNAATGQSRWFRDGIELQTPPPIEDREVPGGELGIPVGGFGVIYDLVGGAIELQGIWDIGHSKVYPRDGGNALSIGTNANQATNLKLIGAIQRRHQDWIVVPRAGDTASGLTQRTIAREFITQDISGVIENSFWTDSSGQSITAPSLQNLVRAEDGFPEVETIEYALSSNSGRLLNGYGIRLPNGSIEVYSDYGLTTPIQSATIAAIQKKEIAKGSPRYPIVNFRTFTVANTEQSIPLVSAKAIDIFNVHKVEVFFGWALGDTQTLNCSPIQASTFYFAQADINFTGNLVLSVSSVPTPLIISQCTTAINSPVIEGLFSQVTQGQLVTGPGILQNTYVKNKNPNSSQITLCDSSGATEVNATASSTTAQLTFSGAVVKIQSWS